MTTDALRDGSDDRGMTQARALLVPPRQAGHYHCVTRCVRRAWLNKGVAQPDGRWTAVSVWARHLGLTKTSPDHRVHDERGGDDFCWGAGQATPLVAGRRLGDVHWPTQPTPALNVQMARWPNLSLVKRLAASCGAAIPRSPYAGAAAFATRIAVEAISAGAQCNGARFQRLRYTLASQGCCSIGSLTDGRSAPTRRSRRPSPECARLASREIRRSAHRSSLPGHRRAGCS